MNAIADKLIQEQLDRIDKAYPQKRKADIVSRMTAFWNGEYPADRFPYTFLETKSDMDIPENIKGFDRELLVQLSAIAYHGENYDDDFYPALSPGIRQITLPSYFGCVEEFASESVRVKPVVTEAGDVYKLPEIGFGPETAGGEMLARMRHWRGRTEGRLAFYETDMQGPFSVASQIYGIEEFLYACYDNPDEVHYLVNKCAEVFIDFSKKMFEIAGKDLIPFHCMPCLYYPQSKGIALSEDLVAVISPDIAREFINPYAEKIAREFGGVVIHTCGSMNHVINALSEIHGLVGVNFSTCETDLADMAAKIKDKLIVVSHNSPLTTGSLPLLDPLAHAEHMGNVLRDSRMNGYTMLVNQANTPEDKKFAPGMDGIVRNLLRA